RDVAASSANHEAEFALVVERLGGAGKMNRGAGSGHAARLLVEEHRERRFFPSGFGDMVGVVQADGEKLRRPPYGRLELHRGERDSSGRAGRGFARQLHRGGPALQKRDHLARQLGRGHRQIDNRIAGDDADSRTCVVCERNKLHGIRPHNAALNLKLSPLLTILPQEGVAKWVPKTRTLLSAYFSQNSRRVFLAIARSLSKLSSHSGYRHCTG